MVGKLLFVCWSAQNRSPTAALLYSDKYLTRAIGIYDMGRKEMLEHLNWCDKAFIMEEEILQLIHSNIRYIHETISHLNLNVLLHKIICLDIEDVYYFDEPALRTLIEEKMRPYLVKKE